MIGKIEQAIIAHLSNANKRQDNSTVDRIAGYKGEFENLIELLGNCRTAVLVTFGGKTLKNRFDSWRDYELTFLIEVYARSSARQENAARFGDDKTPGAYQIAEFVEGQLENNDLGLLAQPLVLQKMTPVFDSAARGFHIAAYELEYSCVCSVGAANDEQYDQLDRFATLDVDWIEDEPANHHTTIKLPQTEEQDEYGD